MLLFSFLNIQANKMKICIQPTQTKFMLCIIAPNELQTCLFTKSASPSSIFAILLLNLEGFEQFVFFHQGLQNQSEEISFLSLVVDI